MQARHVLPALSCVVCVASLLGGCEAQPSDLRVWQPSDHAQVAQPNQAAPNPGNGSPPSGVGAAAGRPSLPEGATRALLHHGLNEAILQLWVDSCAPCHGTLGRGDGPQAAVVRAPDLSQVSWQERATDEGIAAVIRSGRGLMPAFDLPQEAVAGLSALVRLFARRPDGSPAAPGPATPSPAGAP